ncbi:hypothetical protein EV127DRAFT_164858 [Xylaria flabelliformis]|nr:hypothetical protein EV127DRAFT_164858 [Xylaria flabelliformis]
MSTRRDFIARRNSNDRFITDHYARHRSSSPNAHFPRLPPFGGSLNPPRDGRRDKRPSKSYWDLHRRWEEGDKEFYRGSSDMRALLTRKQVNGITDPSRNTNVTIHLELELYDDLDERLEQLAYLSRLGHFDAARAFFSENLQDQTDKPYVSIQYGELLLAQGDYKTLEQQNGLIDGHYNSENDDIILLWCYWNMMQYYAVSHKPQDRPEGILAAAVCVIHDMRTALDVKDLSSTQIKFLALAMQIASSHMTDNSQLALEEELSEFFDKFSKYLYETLLQQGRVWDMHDLMINLIPFRSIDVVFHAIFGTSDLHQGICTIILDWTEHDPNVDISTNLALLGLLTSVISTKTMVLHRDQAAVILQHTQPLATSLMENDPKSMKSRPLVRWILEKARTDEERFIETQVYFRRLQSSIGVAYNPIRTILPQYAPLKQENPGWNVAEASPELRGPVRLGFRTAQEMGDYELMILSLQLIIRFSTDPRKEFEELCYLQRSVCEDYQGYVDTLVSSYLVSDTEEAKAKLFQNLSAQILGTNCLGHLPEDLFFMANLLLHSLSGGMRNSRVTLRNAQISYAELNTSYKALKEEIARKFAGWNEFVGSYEDSVSRRANNSWIQRSPSAGRVYNFSDSENSRRGPSPRPSERSKRYDTSSDSSRIRGSETDDSVDVYLSRRDASREQQPDKRKTHYNHSPIENRWILLKDFQPSQTAQRQSEPDQQDETEGTRLNEPGTSFLRSRALVRSKQGAERESKPARRTQRHKLKEAVPGIGITTKKDSFESRYVQPTVEDMSLIRDEPVIEEVD